MAVVRVRAPVPADGPGIGRVHVRAWQSAYAGMMPDEFLDHLDEVERGQAWAQRLSEHERLPTADRDCEYLVAEASRGGRWTAVGRQVVGVATIGPERDPSPDDEAPPTSPGTAGDQAAADDTGELWMINVLPAMWRHGVGSKLMAVATERLADRGHTRAVLWVVEGNSRARRFYERLGWAADGASKVEWFGGAPIRELRYASSLTAPR